MTVRTERERVMLEALEAISAGVHETQCSMTIVRVNCGGLCQGRTADRALAKVRQFDTPDDDLGTSYDRAKAVCSGCGHRAVAHDAHVGPCRSGTCYCPGFASPSAMPVTPGPTKK